MDFVKRLNEIRASASYWQAQDGGLTMAAGDLLSMCNIAEQFYVKNDKPGLLRWIGDPWDTSTGLEGDVVSLCLEWAEENYRVFKD